MQSYTDFPANCPPSGLPELNNLVYRFVRNNSPIAKDITSYKEDGKIVTGDKDCEACGVSVYTSLEDVLEAQKSIAGMKKRMIAQARLDKNDGEIKHTPSLSHPNCGHSHHTWWKGKAGEILCKKFTVCKPKLA